jgi:4-oxalocrotonate tautomerase
MPLVHVQMATGRTAEQKRALLNALTNAVERELGASRESIRVWITEFGDTDFMAGGELLADKRARQLAAPTEPPDGEIARVSPGA